MLEKNYIESASSTNSWARAREQSNVRSIGTRSASLWQAVSAARDALLALQHAEGYWCFELEADCTIPAEYILMMHFMDEIDTGLQTKIAVYLRTTHQPHAGWA